MRLIQDLKAYSKGSVKKAIVTALINPCFHAIILFRISSFFHRAHLDILAKIFWYINRVIYAVDIDFRANLAGGLVIFHGVGLVVGMDVVSKGRLTLYQGVTLGGNGRTREIDGKLVDQPVIGTDVIIYTDAKIFGPVIIGDNCVIKSGVIITEDMSCYGK